jgi:cobalt/nickel transport system permease protein
MSCLAFFAGRSPVHRLDPRVRLLSALGLAVAIALSERLVTLGWALGLTTLLAAAARLGLWTLTRRLLHLNAFMLFLWMVLPWSVPGHFARTVWGLSITEEGIRLALEITVKGNAIVLLFTALVATIDPPRLGCALKRLALPDKLVHLFMLVIRYADVIHDEYGRLRHALKARAFQPRFSSHTLRAFGYLVGLLLVRSMERAERVLAAMKCRGFDGHFHALTGFGLRPSDLVFTGMALCHVGAWAWLELS